MKINLTPDTLFWVKVAFAIATLVASTMGVVIAFNNHPQQTSK